ncbi:hypothetical protein Agub_g7861 [Astrephomene gubernaculifera]|uniref:Calmodulin n=1 Tax=Astrephomene gubernaculifera TaxID=47775 RepID=A0AAD3HN20_9CHLO|nr:hypothetical protein Agub_g7861 [Astrephomene gubernaculifera]
MTLKETELLAPPNGGDAETDRQPRTVPEEWRKARAANAEDWFQGRKEELHRQYLEEKQAVRDSKAAAAAAAADEAAYNARVQTMVREQQAFSRSVQQQLTVLRQQRLQVNLEYQALRLPHYTPPRPLALITAPDGGPSFLERLFNRALATTLMTAVTTTSSGSSNGGGGSGSGGGTAAGGVGGGGEAVWCELGQSRVSMQDPQLARAEALERCRMAVVVLSPALQASPCWAIERRILTARLTAPPGTWPGPPLSAVLVVRLHVPPPASAAAAAAAAVAGMGRKAAAAAAAASAAARAPNPNPEPSLPLPDPVPGYPVQRYPLTVLDMTVPQPPEPWAEGTPAGTALAQAVRAAVADILSAASSPTFSPGGRPHDSPLSSSGLRLVPDPPPVHLHPAHIHQQPEQLLLATFASSGSGSDSPALSSSLTLGASLAGAGSSSSLTTQILASPAHAAVAPGPAATAAHLLPPPYTQRAVEDWTMYDTVVWLSSLGRSLGRWCGGFLALAVDGPLLEVADDTDLQAACGVASDKARATIGEALASTLRRTCRLRPSRSLLPGSDGPATPLAPEAAVLPPPQRAALLADMFAYYDRDHSGDLDMLELGRLVRACGLRLSDERLKDVLDDYDDDSDGLLNDYEAARLLEDVWRLVMAQQDLAAWTPSESAAALKDAVDLEWPLETPRATPDAEKAASRNAAAAVAAVAAAVARGSLNGSDVSINIVGSGSGAAERTHRPMGPASPPVSAADPTGSGDGAVGGGGAAAAAACGGDGSSAARSSFNRVGAPSVTYSALYGATETVEGEDETGARVRLVDKTASASAVSVFGGSGSGGSGSVASYTWGLPPRLSQWSNKSRRTSDAGSITSTTAPWAGAITPRVPTGKHHLSPEEMAARDVDVQRLLRRERGEAELREALRRVAEGLDLRRSGRVELQMLRAALAASGPQQQLTPLHTQILSDLADAHAQLPTATTDAAAIAAHNANRNRMLSSGSLNGSRRLLASGPLGEALLGLEVPLPSYISSGVAAVQAAQTTLLHIVYGERGLSAMLRQLYRQGAGPDDPLELLTRGPRVHPGASQAALEALMEVQGLKPTALLRAALLPSHQLSAHRDEEDEEEDSDVHSGGGYGGGSSSFAIRGGGAGGGGGGLPAPPLMISGTPLSLHSAQRYPQAWASGTAHILHVFQQLGLRSAV